MLRKAGFMGMFMFLVMVMPGYPVQARTPQDTLNQYISQLQSNPNDTALREKIIRFVQTMNPAPAVPEEARRDYVIGLTLFKEAKSVQDYNDAIDKLKAALLAAPWWADAYRDMGMALEAAQRYDEAISSLKLFIAANPGGGDARKARDEIYIIEAKQEKAAKEAAEASSPEAIAARKQQEFEDLLRKIDGRNYRDGHGNELTVHGRHIVWCITRQADNNGGSCPDKHNWTGIGGDCDVTGIQGYESKCSGSYTESGGLRYTDYFTYIINEEGETITQQWRRETYDIYGKPWPTDNNRTFNWYR